MKRIYFLIITFAVLNTVSLQGQIVIHGNEQVRLTDGTFKLKADSHRGNIQWQFSGNFSVWTDIQGQTGETLLVTSVGNEGWYRAKITEGTCAAIYSDTMSVVFATPRVETLAADSTGTGYARIRGRVTDSGGTQVLQRGFYWSKTDENPGSQSNTVVATGVTQDFSVVLTGLEANTTYYVKAFASNSKGISVGEVITFKTSSLEMTGKFTDARDGKAYNWVRIGEQVWMAENLAYLPAVSSPETGSETIPHYYVYDYSGNSLTAAKATANFTTFGVLYNWPASMNGAATSSTKPSGVQGVCPAGWHLPSDAEWTELENYLIVNGFNFDGTTVGNKLAKSFSAKSHWNISTANGAPGNNLSANNSSGFSALPGGTRMDEGYFYYLNGTGLFWSTTQEDGTRAYKRYIFSFHPSVAKYWDYKSRGLSVRCVRNEATIPVNQPPAVPGISVPANNATGMSLAPTLSWQGSDPDGDPVSYDLYLGTTSPPAIMVAANLTGTSYTVSASLQGSTDYYWQVVAKDNQGNTTESPVWKFTTIASGNLTGKFTDARDGKAYNWVKIGDQTWMAENLAYLPAVSQPGTGSVSSSLYYVYGYNGTDVSAARSTIHYSRYGVLYNWSAAMSGAASSSANPSGVQGVCPAGWYLPSDAEWTQLQNYLIQNGYGYQGSGDDIAKSLAAKLYWEDYGEPGSPGNDKASNNASGFSALPGGMRHAYGNFVGLLDMGFWWTTTSVTQNTAWARDMWSFDTVVLRSHDFIGGKETGGSVRCLKSVTNLPPLTPHSPAPADNTRGISPTPALTWQCSDPDEDPLTYDVYLGTAETPATLIAGNLSVKSFTVTSALKYGNTHYWKVVAKDNQGNVTDGPVWKFTVELPPIATGTFTDDRDMKNYKWVKIGNQTWMSENLAYLPSVSLSATGSENDKFYYVYNYEGTSVAAAKATSNYTTYGVLYNWPAAMDGGVSSTLNPSGKRGVCPAGWHIPSVAEWDHLENYLVEHGFNFDGTTTGYKVAKSMAAKILWNASPETGDVGNDLVTNNASGFSGLPGGIRSRHGGFAAIGTTGAWWCATEKHAFNAWTRKLDHIYEFVFPYDESKGEGNSVRCVKD